MFGFIKKQFFPIAVVIILLLATFLRFYQYNERWGLAYDQAHDVLVARYAVENFKLPLLGPFSSAGPFQTGGEWYWIIMLGTAIYPFSVMTPWILMTSLYVIFVALMIYFAKELIDKKFALIVGLLTAVSTAQVAQGTNLTNQSPEALFALLAVWFAIRFLRAKKRVYLFLSCLFVSTAASIHLQGVALFFLIIFTYFFTGKPQIKDLFIIISGLLIPWVPVFIVDIDNNFFNIKNMIQYYLHDQYKISLDVLGRRWLTYAGLLWPKMWSHVIGGNIIFGYILSIFVFIIAFYKLIIKKLPKEWTVLLLSFIGSIVLIRYTRTPIFDSYIVFLHPLILLLSAWVIYICLKKYKFIGIVVLLLIFIFSFKKSFQETYSSRNYIVPYSRQLREELVKKYPDTKFAVYEFKNKTITNSYSLALFLDEKNLSSPDGKKIGIKYNSNQKFVDLKRKSHAQLRKEGWYLITPETVYLNTQKWYKSSTGY